MCGILFVEDKESIISEKSFLKALKYQSWRGPDYTGYKKYGRSIKLGHNRLTILDASSSANMPMENEYFAIIFNGEIYNHIELRSKFDLNCNTHSDTETILEGYTKFGEQFLCELRGMFSIVIYDILNKSWIACRDPFGIKPLYGYEKDGTKIFASETKTIRLLTPEETTISNDSISEWKSFRRPIPGKTFFNEIFEVLPGHIIDSNGRNEHLFKFNKEELTVEEYSLNKFEKLLIESINIHQINDFKSVSLLSGGLDSAVILGLSMVEKAYTIGITNNNEFHGAAESATKLNRELIKVEVSNDDLYRAWETLIRLREEPLSLPNEGLIFLVCSSMNKDEKVLLTGEGADELLFGYDRIYKWAAKTEMFSINEFIEHYCYNFDGLTKRMKEYLESLSNGKTTIEFIEDFFIQFHLPGLLRRMDFSSMAASKEARVPFVDIKLFQFMYRQKFDVRVQNERAKSPLIEIAKKLELHGAVERKKIGFSATLENKNKADEYKAFQKYCLTTLNWQEYI